MTRSAAKIDRDPEVRQIAKTLGIEGPNLRAKLCKAAVDRVRDYMGRFDIVPATLADVHATVLSLTGVRIERIESNADLSRVSRAYKTTQDAAGVQLEFEFAAKTEALVFRDDTCDRREPSFTAFIDARGERGFRAWFAERHEPAHLLIPDPSGKDAWRRTTEDRPEPLEQVVDAIAAEVGFWEPVTRPCLQLALLQESSVLDAFDRVRDELAPTASREACYRAFARLVDFPLALVRVEHACRRADKKNAGASFALRAVTVIHNDAGERAGIRVWQNFRIPSHSIIHGAPEDTLRTHTEHDDLQSWRSESSGRSLSQRSLPVRVTCRGRWAALEPAA